jgi:hypothetical protein
MYDYGQNISYFVMFLTKIIVVGKRAVAVCAVIAATAGYGDKEEPA